MGNNKNVIVGAADIYIGPPGSDKPAVAAGVGSTYRSTMSAGANGTTNTAVGTLITNWRGVGYTQDGLEVATDPSFGEVEVDQLMDAARIFKDGMGLSISTTLAEATLKNLALAWGQSDSTLVTGAEDILTIQSGVLGEAPLERGLIAIGNGPITDTNVVKERTYHAFRVLSVEGSSHSLSRADATTVPVTFRALPADDGRYGVIRDRAPSTV